MLKTITLKNFVHFKDETVIQFDASNRRAGGNEQQRIGAKKKQSVACNSLHIFVGPNFCGKSTILELIRRCMTDKINLSKTKVSLEDSVAYAFCKFDDGVISGIIAEPHQHENRSRTEYKFFIYHKENETFFRYKSSNNSACVYGDVIKKEADKDVIKKLLGGTKEANNQSGENHNHENITYLLEILEHIVLNCLINQTGKLLKTNILLHFL